jgi:glycosyltransferase involved in cell wall biosynthesis
VPDVLERARTWTIGVSSSVDPEAGPLALLEYFSIGLPAVATAHGGSAEVIDDAGLLVPPRDPDAMAHALERLLDDADLRRRFAKNGPQVIERTRLTVDAFRDNMLQCLNELAGRAGAGAGSAS